uniref:Uncharacterized protein n=1 Tax=Cacopsylla melanoneura TaxID=428564 RepID=A0A8D9EXR9_9HEMI
MLLLPRLSLAGTQWTLLRSCSVWGCATCLEHSSLLSPSRDLSPGVPLIMRVGFRLRWVAFLRELSCYSRSVVLRPISILFRDLAWRRSLFALSYFSLKYPSFGPCGDLAGPI